MPPIKKHSISVFFPCYNDERSIGNLVKTAFKILPKLTKDYEVIVVNDGSSDKSLEVLEKLNSKYKKLKVVNHKKNTGYGGALKRGFKESTKEIVFYTDGDGQYDVKELPILVSLLSEDVDFVNGIKMTRHDPIHRIFLGNLHRFITRWFFWLPITDVDCDFRLIRRDVLKRLSLESNTGAICVELVKKAEMVGAKFREVEIHHYERQWGKSEFFKLEKIVHTYFDLTLFWIKLALA